MKSADTCAALDVDDEKSEARVDEALALAVASSVEFEEAMESIRDLSIHAGANTAPLDAPSDAFFRAVRVWNKIDSEDTIKRVLFETFRLIRDQVATLAVELTDPDNTTNDLGARESIGVNMFDALDEAVKRLCSSDSPPWRFRRPLQKVLSRKARYDVLLASLLVSATSAFESLVSELMCAWITAFPSILNAKQYKHSEIIKHATIEEFHTAAIRAKVEDHMRGSVKEWFEWLSSHADVDLAKSTSHSTDVIEIFLRRNTIVHNSGKRNEIYNAKLPAGWKEPVDGTHDVDQDYLIKAIDKLQVAGQTLNHWITSKLDGQLPSPTGMANGVLPIVSYELLVAERFEAVIDFSDCVLPRATPAKTTAVLQVNRWIATKELRGLDSIKAEVTGWDVSDLGGVFPLVKEALLDNLDKAGDLAKTLVGTSDLEWSDWIAWPLFEPLRNHIGDLRERGTVASGEPNATEGSRG